MEEYSQLLDDICCRIYYALEGENRSEFSRQFLTEELEVNLTDYDREIILQAYSNSRYYIQQ